MSYSSCVTDRKSSLSTRVRMPLWNAFFLITKKIDIYRVFAIDDNDKEVRDFFFYQPNVILISLLKSFSVLKNWSNKIQWMKDFKDFNINLSVTLYASTSRRKTRTAQKKMTDFVTSSDPVTHLKHYRVCDLWHDVNMTKTRPSQVGRWILLRHDLSWPTILRSRSE